MQLSHSDWQKVSVFLQDLYAQGDAGAFRQTVVTGLLKLIPCEQVGFNEIDSRSNSVVLVVHPWTQDVFTLLPILETHFAEHPQLQHYRQSDDRQVYQTTDFISLREFRQKAIYHDVYRHLNAEHQMTCLLSPPGSAEDIGLALNRKLKKFSDRDKAVLEHLRPHLMRARHNAAAIAKAEDKVLALTKTLDTVQAGLALVDSARRMAWATPQVVRWLELYFPHARRNPDRLPEALDQWLQSHLLALNMGSALTKPPTSYVTHHQNSTLTIRFQPVHEGVTRLIFSQKTELLTADRSQELGLTSREAEVLHWISEGKSNPEIALLLQISPRTVHKHVEHILTKLGVETRMAAVRFISAGV